MADDFGTNHFGFVLGHLTFGNSHLWAILCAVSATLGMELSYFGLRFPKTP